MTYYHGSKHNIKSDYLTPHKSKVINFDKAVFATNTLWLALVFIAHTSDADVEIGIYNSIPFIIECRPGSFDMLKTDGYLYYVDGSEFHSDKRLGMPKHEFIASHRVKINKRKYIKNVLSALRKTDVKIVSFYDKMDAIAKYTKN